MCLLKFFKIKYSTKILYIKKSYTKSPVQKTIMNDAEISGAALVKIEVKEDQFST